MKTASVSSLGRLVIRSTRPLLQAIRTLSPDFEDIGRQWRRSLERVTASRRELDALAAMNPQKVLEGFPKSGFAGFRRSLSAQGERLAAENVALEHAITASQRFPQALPEVPAPAQRVDQGHGALARAPGIRGPVVPDLRLHRPAHDAAAPPRGGTGRDRRKAARASPGLSTTSTTRSAAASHATFTTRSGTTSSS